MMPVIATVAGSETARTMPKTYAEKFAVLVTLILLLAGTE